MQRWNPETCFVGLRISNIFTEADYAAIPGFQADPESRKWNLWSWVDSRDVAQACRLALDHPRGGAEVFTIAAADTLMPTPSAELMAQHFPGVPVSNSLGPIRHAAVHRQGARRAGLRAEAHMADAGLIR